MRHLSDDDLDIIAIFLDERILSKLDRIERLLVRLLNQEGENHMDLTRLQADVEADTNAVNSATLLLGQLAQEIRDNADDPEALAALAEQLEANTASLSAAVTANTPGAGIVNGPENASETGTPDDGVASNDGSVVGDGQPTV